MKGGHEEKHTKQQQKESPLCYIDGHPPHSEAQVHPGECSKEQPQERRFFLCFMILYIDDVFFFFLICGKLVRSLTKLLTIDINGNFKTCAEDF